MKRIFLALSIFCLTATACFCQDALIVLPDGSVNVNGSITASEGVKNAILPIGTILMYDGTGIADVALRIEKIGANPSDTIGFDLYGDWYVCNGQSGTPDLMNRFIRCESTSGNTGGEDAHVLTIDEMPSHAHGGYTGYTNPSHSHVAPLRGESGYSYPFGQDGAYGAYRYRGSSDYLAPNPKTSTADINHRHIISPEGGGQAHENRPAYYSLIFIVRKQ